MLIRLLLLCIAGSAGTLARYGVYEACSRSPLSKYPAATLLVNIVGSFLFGVVWGLWGQERLSMQTRIILLSGFMGAFTTFSSFAFDTGDLMLRGQYAAAALNVLANNVLGIGALFLGLWVAGGLARTA